MAAPLTVANLSMTYSGGLSGGGVRALSDVSLELRSGEVFGLLGPNGAGKTTLVKSALGLLRPETGTIELFGAAPSDPHSRSRAGYLPENHDYPSRMTGRALLRLAGRLAGVAEGDLNERIAHTLELVDMTEWAGRRLGKYSKGMSQRIGIAQALLHDPDILLLDEPNEGIDPVGRAEIARIIRELRDRGKTILINSHALAEIEQICDRVAILKKGELVSLGTVRELTAIGQVFELEGDFSGLTERPPSTIASFTRKNDTHISARLPEGAAIDALTDWLRQRECSIHELKPGSRTLEDVFVSLVSSGATRDASDVAASYASGAAGESGEPDGVIDAEDETTGAA